MDGFNDSWLSCWVFHKFDPGDFEGCTVIRKMQRLFRSSTHQFCAKFRIFPKNLEFLILHVSMAWATRKTWYRVETDDAKATERQGGSSIHAAMPEKSQPATRNL